MALASSLRVFEIDDRDDRARSNNDDSRFGVYVRQRADWFDDWHDSKLVTVDPVRFAVAAWSVATGPVMAPGYVRCKTDRLIQVVCRRNEDNGGLLAVATFTAPRPVQLREFNRYADWQYEAFGGGRYIAPYEDQLADRPALLTTVEAAIQLNTDDLFDPIDAPEVLSTDDAKQAVLFVAELLDEPLAKLCEAMDR